MKCPSPIWKIGGFSYVVNDLPSASRNVSQNGAFTSANTSPPALPPANRQPHAAPRWSRMSSAPVVFRKTISIADSFAVPE